MEGLKKSQKVVRGEEKFRSRKTKVWQREWNERGGGRGKGAAAVYILSV